MLLIWDDLLDDIKSCGIDFGVVFILELVDGKVFLIWWVKILWIFFGVWVFFGKLIFYIFNLFLILDVLLYINYDFLWYNIYLFVILIFVFILGGYFEENEMVRR